MNEQNTPANSASLPPVSSLLKESWELFKKSLLNLFILSIIAFVAYIGLFVIFLVVAFLFGFGSFFALQSGVKDIQQLLGPQVLIIVLSSIPIFLIGSIIISSIVQSGIILIFEGESSGQKIALSQLIRKGFGFIIPLFVMGVILFFLEFGGFFVFIIPTFLFALLFLFAPYEVILENRKGTEALKRSLFIVSKNFGEIFVRVSVMIGLSLLIWFLNSLFSNIRDLGAFFSLIFSLLSVVFSWYIAAYYFTLYKHAKSVVNTSEKGNLKWVWVVAIIGWVIGILIIVSTATLISNLVSSGALQKAIEQSKKGNMQYRYDLKADSETNIGDFSNEFNKQTEDFEKTYQDAKDRIQESQDEFDQIKPTYSSPEL